MTQVHLTLQLFFCNTDGKKFWTPLLLYLSFRFLTETLPFVFGWKCWLDVVVKDQGHNEPAKHDFGLVSAGIKQIGFNGQGHCTAQNIF